MKMNITKMKEKAAKKLKGKYSIIIPAILIYALIIFFFYIVSKSVYNDSVDILFNILITGLLYMGLLQIVIKISKGEKTKITDLFERTDLFWKASAITILRILTRSLTTKTHIPRKRLISLLTAFTRIYSAEQSNITRI